MRIAIGEIKINDKRREAVAERVKALAQSMAEIGLLNPVTVDQAKTLIAGLHRLEAAKLLEWTEIECTICNLNSLQAELAEIDENFIRNDLSSMEYGDLLLRRKEIYEALHPKTKHGGDRKSDKIKSPNWRLDSEKSFVDDTAEKLGVGTRTIQRQLQIARNIAPEVKEILRDSAPQITQRETEKLSRLKPEQQKEAAQMLVAGEIRKIDEYLADKQGESAKSDKEPAPLHSQSMPSDEPVTAKFENATTKSQDAGYTETETKPQEEDKEQEPVSLATPTTDDAQAPVSLATPTTDDAQAPVIPPAQSQLPFAPVGRQFQSFEEGVADLKNPNKDCSCTPDSFLAEITACVQEFHRQIEWYNTPYYEAIFPMITLEQLDYFRQQMQSIQADIDNLTKNVEGKSKQ